MSAFATNEYVEEKSSDEFAESYRIVLCGFYPGKRGGNWAKSVSGEEVIDAVSDRLEQSGFRLASEDEEPELLIYLHYGVSPGSSGAVDLTGFVDFDSSEVVFPSLFGVRGSEAAREIRNARRMDAIAIRADHYSNWLKKKRYTMAELLGVDEDDWKRLKKNGVPPEALIDERYFVSLFAYRAWEAIEQEAKHEDDLDAKTPKEKTDDEEEPDPLWTIKYSVRANGQSYKQAIEDMNLVAADYFGKDLDR